MTAEETLTVSIAFTIVSSGTERMQGLEHFFPVRQWICSHPDHFWLQTSVFYVEKGIATVIDWLVHTGGTDINMGQRVQMNHANVCPVPCTICQIGWDFMVSMNFFCRRLPVLCQCQRTDSGAHNQTNRTVFDLLTKAASDTSVAPGSVSGQLPATTPQCHRTP